MITQYPLPRVHHPYPSLPLIFLSQFTLMGVTGDLCTRNLPEATINSTHSNWQGTFHRTSQLAGYLPSNITIGRAPSNEHHSNWQGTSHLLSPAPRPKIEISSTKSKFRCLKPFKILPKLALAVHANYFALGLCFRALVHMNPLAPRLLLSTLTGTALTGRGWFSWLGA